MARHLPASADLLDADRVCAEAGEGSERVADVSLRVLSYGGGVQSTALLVMAAQREIQIDAALFANVGDDSEHPATLDYVRRIAVPYGAEHGIDVIELRRVRKPESQPTLLLETLRQRKGEVIPARLATGRPGKRSCTTNWKIRVIGRWLRQHGASATSPAQVCVGISLDEAQRVGGRTLQAYEQPQYPLLDRRLTRADCKAIIERAGLPVPPKSSCYFCPYKRPSEWARMRRDSPVLFRRAAELERVINERRDRNGQPHVYLTRFGKPLANAIGTDEQPDLDFGSGPGETCDEGYCWT